MVVGRPGGPRSTDLPMIFTTSQMNGCLRRLGKKRRKGLDSANKNTQKNLPVVDGDDAMVMIHARNTLTVLLQPMCYERLGTAKGKHNKLALENKQ